MLVEVVLGAKAPWSSSGKHFLFMIDTCQTSEVRDPVRAVASDASITSDGTET
jgi:hypothetical protein